MKKAMYFKKLENGKVQCTLCPHKCIISENNYGICKVRKNISGELFVENYALLSAVNFDPIEKKPLYHYYPNKIILSVGSVGCNMHCDFCQNFEISQIGVDRNNKYIKDINTEELVELALSNPQNIGIAYTYNEPFTFYEFMLETAKVVKTHELKNIVVSNGFIEKKPLEELIKYIDAFNIDLKAFNDNFYKNVCGANLKNVKNTLLTLADEHKYFEISCLIIPEMNDNEEEFYSMAEWIHDNLGRKTVLHINRYHPMYKMKTPATDIKILEKLYHIAKKKLDYVYIGNISESMHKNTYCHNCNTLLLERTHFETINHHLKFDGTCKNCGEKIMDNI